MDLQVTLRKVFVAVLSLGLGLCLAAVITGLGSEMVLAAAQAKGHNSWRSIQPIAGIWQEADALDARELTIYGDGKYELVYKGGGKAFGKVKVTTEKHPDGSKSLWYSFYEGGGVVLEDKDTGSPGYKAFNSANELWAAFPKDEKIMTQTELRSGHDGALHFVRYGDSNYGANSADSKGEDYLGVWGCGRCSAVISRKGPIYQVELQWASSAAEGSRWVYQCTYDNYGALLFSDDNGTRIDYVCSEQGKETSKTIYNDGRGYFVLRQGKLLWQDKKENAGNLLEFIKAPQ